MWRPHHGEMLEVALDAVARVHRDPADAAPRMMEVNTAAEARDGVDVSSWPRPHGGTAAG